MLLLARVVQESFGVEPSLILPTLFHRQWKGRRRQHLESWRQKIGSRLLGERRIVAGVGGYSKAEGLCRLADRTAVSNRSERANHGLQQN